MQDVISRAISSAAFCRFPEDLYVAPDVRVVFASDIDGVEAKTMAGYSVDNAFEMRFVGRGASSVPVRVLHEAAGGRWADVAPWPCPTFREEDGRRYFLMIGRRYRVIHEGADEDAAAIFEIHPPELRDIARVCCRKPSSYAIHLQRMMLGHE